jgi:hypothetical protein
MSVIRALGHEDRVNDEHLKLLVERHARRSGKPGHVRAVRLLGAPCHPAEEIAVLRDGFKPHLADADFVLEIPLERCRHRVGIAEGHHGHAVPNHLRRLFVAGFLEKDLLDTRPPGIDVVRSLALRRQHVRRDERVDSVLLPNEKVHLRERRGFERLCGRHGCGSSARRLLGQDLGDWHQLRQYQKHKDLRHVLLHLSDLQYSSNAYGNTRVLKYCEKNSVNLTSRSTRNCTSNDSKMSRAKPIT